MCYHILSITTSCSSWKVLNLYLNWSYNIQIATWPHQWFHKPRSKGIAAWSRSEWCDDDRRPWGSDSSEGHRKPSQENHGNFCPPFFFGLRKFLNGDVIEQLLFWRLCYCPSCPSCPKNPGHSLGFPDENLTPKVENDILKAKRAVK